MEIPRTWTHAPDTACKSLNDIPDPSAGQMARLAVHLKSNDLLMLYHQEAIDIHKTKYEYE
jgi:hypothetical protein